MRQGTDGQTASGCALNALKARFLGLWSRCSLPETEADPTVVWAGLIESYNESWRQYHTAEHLCHCLQQLDLTSSLMEDPAAVEIALWFHDIILKPDASDNEEKSAELFKHTAEKHLPSGFVNRVSSLILATEHRDPPQGLDARYLCDIDLSSLAFPWEQFLKDSNALRAEQSGITDTQFYPAKIRFLSTLLERPTIFLTDFFQTRYESTARENIQRYIMQLEANGYT
jgi:predicted metal-dependent HD superfamily phosphohydrolase